jgi:hypothetical protein
MTSLDHRVGYPPSQTEGRLTLLPGSRANPKLIDYGKYVAYLYYQGKLVADSTGDNKYR